MSIWTPGGKDVKNIWVMYEGAKREISTVWGNKDGEKVLLYRKKPAVTPGAFILSYYEGSNNLDQRFFFSKDLLTWKEVFPYVGIDSSFENANSKGFAGMSYYGNQFVAVIIRTTNLPNFHYDHAVQAFGSEDGETWKSLCYSDGFISSPSKIIVLPDWFILGGDTYSWIRYSKDLKSFSEAQCGSKLDRNIAVQAMAKNESDGFYYLGEDYGYSFRGNDFPNFPSALSGVTTQNVRYKFWQMEYMPNGYVYAANSSAFYKTNGTKWSAVPGIGTTSFLKFGGSKIGYVYKSTYQTYGQFRIVDVLGGDTVETVSNVDVNASPSQMLAGNGLIILNYANVSDVKAFYVSDDGGQTWSAIPLPNLVTESGVWTLTFSAQGGTDKEGTTG